MFDLYEMKAVDFSDELISAENNREVTFPISRKFELKNTPVFYHTLIRAENPWR